MLYSENLPSCSILSFISGIFSFPYFSSFYSQYRMEVATGGTLFKDPILSVAYTRGRENHVGVFHQLSMKWFTELEGG